MKSTKSRRAISCQLKKSPYDSQETLWTRDPIERLLSSIQRIQYPSTSRPNSTLTKYNEKPINTFRIQLPKKLKSFTESNQKIPTEVSPDRDIINIPVKVTQAIDLTVTPFIRAATREDHNNLNHPTKVCQELTKQAHRIPVKVPLKNSNLNSIDVFATTQIKPPLQPLILKYNQKKTIRQTSVCHQELDKILQENQGMRPKKNLLQKQTNKMNIVRQATMAVKKLKHKF